MQWSGTGAGTCSMPGRGRKQPQSFTRNVIHFLDEMVAFPIQVARVHTHGLDALQGQVLDGVSSGDQAKTSNCSCSEGRNNDNERWVPSLPHSMI